MAKRTEGVEFKMLPGCFQRLLRRINKRDLTCFSHSSMDRKRSGVTKTIENLSPHALSPDGESVFSLIKVETGFLPLPHVNSKPTTVFFDVDTIGHFLPVEVADCFWQPFFFSCRDIAPLEDRPRMEVSHQGFDQDRFQSLHPCGRDLQNQGLPIAVQHQSRKEVPFPVYKAIRIGFVSEPGFS